MENSEYFKELSRILRQHDIEIGPVEDGELITRMDGQPVGRIEQGGTRYVAPGDLRTAEASDAFHKAAPFSEMVAEYTGALKRAPLLKAEGLEENFRLLAEFNGTVLAGKELEGGYGMQFVTWRWDYSHTSVMHGNYCHDNYEGAKADFAERSGLVQKGRYFSDEQLTRMYDCMADALDGQFEPTLPDEDAIRSICEQIATVIPDLTERIEQEQEGYDKFEKTM